MHKMLFSFIKHYKCFNFLYRLMLINMYIPELNQIKRSIPIVVSLSSDEDSFDNLEYTLYSLFNQKVSPDKVVLWLSNEYELSELPYSITKFVKKGLDIRFVEDKESYTNIIYALNRLLTTLPATPCDEVAVGSGPLTEDITGALSVGAIRTLPVPRNTFTKPSPVAADPIGFPVRVSTVN